MCHQKSDVIVEEKSHHEGHGCGHSHSQCHHHHHAHGDAAAMTESNRDHWDSMAKSYSSQPWQQEMLNTIHAFVLSNLSFLGVNWIDPAASFESSPTTNSPPLTVRVLDYACGPGTISDILYAHASEFVGVDLSPKMVEAYNERFSDSDAPIKAKAYNANLIDPRSTEKVPEVAEESFDLVAVGLGFHHFSDLNLATSRLVSYLKPGGVFMIVDFVTHEAAELGALPGQHTVTHLGFGDTEVRRLFGGNGLVDVEVRVMEGEVLLRGTTPRRVFIAKGRKSA